MNNYRKFEAKIEEYLLQSDTKREIIEYLLSIKSFKSFDDWQMIIRALFFVDEIRTISPERIVESIHNAQDEYGKAKVDEFIVALLKEDSDVEKDYSGFLYILNQQLKNHTKETLTKEDVNGISDRRLERYTQKGTDISKAFSQFYSCWDHVDEKNDVHITADALKFMRGFIEKVPLEYLEFLIRPKYVPVTKESKLDGDFYSFVMEPFTEQIFGDWLKFEEFLNSQKKVYPEITGYVSSFYDRYKISGYSFVGIKDEELDNYGNLLRRWLT